jgi:hypothetical protein
MEKTGISFNYFFFTGNRWFANDTSMPKAGCGSAGHPIWPLGGGETGTGVMEGRPAVVWLTRAAC